MMVTMPAEVSGPQTAAAADTTGASSSSLGKDEFLSLLLAQLKYQDPLSPMENSDFTAQMAQFSSLEQLFSVNDNLAGLQQIGLSTSNTQALTLIGREVEVAGNVVNVTSGEAADMSFNLAQDAESVSIHIANASGEVVQTIEIGAASSGSNRTPLGAASLPDGVYTYTIDAVNGNGEEIEAETYMSGVVDSISMEGGVIYVNVGDTMVTMSEILRVSRTDEQSVQINEEEMGL